MNVFILVDNGGLDIAPSIWAVLSGQDLVMLLLALVLLAGMVVVGVVSLYLLLILRKLLGPVTVAAPTPVDTRSLGQWLWGTRPLSQEHDLVMAHSYDGIAELDNPAPPWFMGLFYGTIAIAVLYMISYHIVGSGDIMGTEYKQEMALGDQQREAYIAKVAGGINENTVTRLVDAKGIGAGKVLFVQNCVVCHGANAEGKVGPNLTDAFWLHGGTVNRIFHTLTEGVPEKGMISWKKQLNPLQLQQLASYVMSLQGSNPAGAKAPQGDKETAAGVPVAMR